MKKIVILGPESTGKSFLSEQLANHYQTNWVPEFARTYLEKKGIAYQFEDLYQIAEGQLQAEATALSSANSRQHNKQPGADALFIDTDLYTIKIWSEISFNQCDNRILSRIATRNYNAYLLCNTDLPWTPDPLREYPDLSKREMIYQYYKDALVNQSAPWVEIKGGYSQRLDTATFFLDKLFAGN